MHRGLLDFALLMAVVVVVLFRAVTRVLVISFSVQLTVAERGANSTVVTNQQ